MTDPRTQKIRRPARFYTIYIKSETDVCVMHGNKIVSRHTTERAADEALAAILKPQAA